MITGFTGKYLSLNKVYLKNYCTIVLNNILRGLDIKTV